MAIDFTLSPEIEALRQKVRAFIEGTVAPAEPEIQALKTSDKKAYIARLIALRKAARAEGLWLPHMGNEWGAV